MLSAIRCTSLRVHVPRPEVTDERLDVPGDAAFINRKGRSSLRSPKTSGDQVRSGSFQILIAHRGNGNCRSLVGLLSLRIAPFCSCAADFCTTTRLLDCIWSIQAYLHSARSPTDANLLDKHFLSRGIDSRSRIRALPNTTESTLWWLAWRRRECASSMRP